ncbi:unnamed protein product [Paramecium primaurelia]|uniref:Beta-lactamase-related domain-containing protein n=1 Tax=Paramecium primaurelia TaxID=5886 RepID=A0A8S1MJK2_PARPR|nr:unnamed protein product [Paramecium primaurelia]
MYSIGLMLLMANLVLGQDFTALDNYVELQIYQKRFPGAVIGIQDGNYQYTFKYGRTEYPGDPEDQALLKTSIFDLASVSKVVGCTTAAMLLWEQGKLNIEESVQYYLPEFPHPTVRIRHLLLHNSGLPPDAPLGNRIWTKEEVLDWLYTKSTLLQAPGEKYIYSDLSMVTLQQVIERITGTTLDVYLDENIFKPLGMQSTMFNPSADLKYRIPPTQRDEVVRKRLIWGEVHDPTAYYLGGVSGNAGLFSTVYDLIKFMQMMLGKTSLFKYETLQYWTKVEEGLPYANSRALGWDTVPIQTYPPCGSKFSKNSFGHTGYTGTSVWADRDKDLIVVILTNRVYPDDKTSVVQFRYEATNLIVDILQDQHELTQ